jgi:hypothetical protein
LSTAVLVEAVAVGNDEGLRDLFAEILEAFSDAIVRNLEISFVFSSAKVAVVPVVDKSDFRSS